LATIPVTFLLPSGSSPVTIPEPIVSTSQVIVFQKSYGDWLALEPTKEILKLMYYRLGVIGFIEICLTCLDNQILGPKILWTYIFANQNINSFLSLLRKPVPNLLYYLTSQSDFLLSFPPPCSKSSQSQQANLNSRNRQVSDDLLKLLKQELEKNKEKEQQSKETLTFLVEKLRKRLENRESIQLAELNCSMETNSVVRTGCLDPTHQPQDLKLPRKIQYSLKLQTVISILLFFCFLILTWFYVQN